MELDYDRDQVIWPKPLDRTKKPDEADTKKEIRVAAYCRVSTELDEQKDSFELQQKYYTNLITRTPGWRLAGIYTDEGITGTARKKRIGLERLVRHCEEGKIDKVLCKSISRFARNTIDLLEIVRRLKDLGIGIVFEKENIDTLSVQSEFILSTIAALAQEESRSISENMSWAFNKQFLSGVPVFRRMLGYNVTGKGHKNKIIQINEAEAEIVREIFQMVLDGHWYTAICRELMRKGYKTTSGKPEWNVKTIMGILENERYTGNVLCQKSYTSNYLTHKKKINQGERQQVLIENHHPAIIDQETFDAVQKIIHRNVHQKQKKPTKYPFSGRLTCGECGAVLHLYGPFPHASWACSRRNKNRGLK